MTTPHQRSKPPFFPSCSPFHAKKSRRSFSTVSLPKFLQLAFSPLCHTARNHDLSGLAGRAMPSLLLTFWSPSRRNFEGPSKPQKSKTVARLRIILGLDGAPGVRVLLLRNSKPASHLVATAYNTYGVCAAVLRGLLIVVPHFAPLA